MKDFYKELNLEKTASAQEIRAAYKKHALFYHPDKGGSSEKMQSLNQAYHTLIDPMKRKAFDQEWETFKSFDDDSPVTCNVIYLDKTESIPFSEAFKQKHASLVIALQLKPRHRSDASPYFKKMSFTGKKPQDLSELYVPLDACLNESISPKVAISMLLHWLHGNTAAEHIEAFIKRCQNVPSNPYLPLENTLYEGVINLISQLKSDSPKNKLKALQKITNYAFSQSPIPRYIAALLQNSAFRACFKNELQQVWLTPSSIQLKVFNGKDSLKTLLKKLEENGCSQKSFLALLRLFNQFEKGISSKHQRDPNQYRQEAYTILDWIPTFSTHAGLAVVINSLLQAGVYFQYASQREKIRAQRRADEGLAQNLYLLAFSMTQRATPDLTLYVGTHILRYLALFQYAEGSFGDIVEGIQHRVFQLADIFPFYHEEQSNVDLLFRSEEKALHGMRDLLQALMEVIEYNQLSDQPMLIDHQPVSVLYQAYEASLQNWYTEQHEPEQENRLRLNLMCELLEEKGWCFDDITQNMDFSWQVDRDEDGWLSPREYLNFGNTKETDIFQSITGVKVDYQKGSIEFVATPWRSDKDDTSERHITVNDLKEMIERGIDGAFFSLDPVEPDLPYHPFNAMRFAPSQLYETEFLKTMLLADYLLKFLTMKQEIQGQFPYGVRPIQKILEEVPELLTKFINNFHQSSDSESLHRFWIEAREVPTAVYDFDNGEETFHCFAFDDIEMVVKKHLMERDVKGNLVDADESQEGWHFYDLNTQEREEVQSGKRILDKPAIIFNTNSNQLYFYEEEGLSECFVFQNYEDHLNELAAEADANRKIPKNAENEWLFYFLTQTITEEAKKPNHFSREYIFAREFTDRYNILAHYFPELGRLRELSRITVIIRFLKNIREHNKSTINDWEILLSNTTHWGNRGKEIKLAIAALWEEYKRELNTHRDKISVDLEAKFEKWRRLLPPLDQRSAYQKALAQIVRCFDGIPSLTPHLIDMALFYKDRRLQVIEACALHALKPLHTQIKKQITELEQVIPSEKAAIQKKLDTCYRLEEQFKTLGLGAKEQPIDLKNKCLWVPANIQHRFFKVGENQHAQVSYGGVYIQPKVNLLQQNSQAAHAVLQSVYNNTQQQRISGQRVAAGGSGGNTQAQGGFNRREVTKGFQDHHIISNKHSRTKEHPLVEKANFNMESRANKIFLPTKAENHPARSIHNGRHLNSVSVKLAQDMDTIVMKGQANHWTSAQYNSALRELLAEQRVELKAGNIVLNKHKRPWAN